MPCIKRWVKHSSKKSEGYLTRSWMKSWFSLACSTGVLHWALHICLKCLNNSSKLWCHLCSSVAISYDLVHDFFPLWVTNCSWSLCNWMGLFYFFTLPSPHTESTDLLVLIGGKTPTAKFSITSQWEFTSTWVAIVTWHNSASHTEGYFVGLENVWMGSRVQENPRQSKIERETPAFANSVHGPVHRLMWAHVLPKDGDTFSGQDKLTASSTPAFVCTNGAEQRFWEGTAGTLRVHLLRSPSLSLKPPGNVRTVKVSLPSKQGGCI